MASIGSVTVEVRPTVTLDSANACVMMLNLFLKDNEEYRLEVGDDGKWRLADGPCAYAVGGVFPNHGSPSNMTDEERERLAAKVMKAMKDMDERMA